jgi:hypothetical protein
MCVAVWAAFAGGVSEGGRRLAMRLTHNESAGRHQPSQSYRQEEKKEKEIKTREREMRWAASGCERRRH